MVSVTYNWYVRLFTWTDRTRALPATYIDYKSEERNVCEPLKHPAVSTNNTQ